MRGDDSDGDLLGVVTSSAELVNDLRHTTRQLHEYDPLGYGTTARVDPLGNARRRLGRRCRSNRRLSVPVPEWVWGALAGVDTERS